MNIIYKTSHNQLKMMAQLLMAVEVNMARLVAASHTNS